MLGLQLIKTSVQRYQEAVDRGVFGSPAFFAGDRQFFGKDRLNLFEAAIESTAATL